MKGGDGFFFDSHYFILFRLKNSIKTKYRNCLKSETVDKLLRILLNSGSMEKVKAAEFLIAKKEKTFKAYLESKIQYY